MKEEASVGARDPEATVPWQREGGDRAKWREGITNQLLPAHTAHIYRHMHWAHTCTHTHTHTRVHIRMCKHTHTHYREGQREMSQHPNPTSLEGRPRYPEGVEALH